MGMNVLIKPIEPITFKNLCIGDLFRCCDGIDKTIYMKIGSGTALALSSGILIGMSEETNVQPAQHATITVSI